MSPPSVLALAFTGLFLVACGSADEPDGSAAPSPSAPSAPSEPPVPSPSEQDEEAESTARLSHLGYAEELDAEADPSLSGVVRHDRARTSPGYNLYCNAGNQVYVLDMEGKRVHTMSLAPERERTVFAELLADGTLAVVCNYQLLTRLDWDSRVLWQSPVRAHHDVAERADGVLYVPYRKAETYQGREVRFDGIALLSPAGKVLSSWYTFDHLAELARHYPPSFLDRPAKPNDPLPESDRPPDYHHLNTVELLPDTELGRRDRRFRAGNVLVCFRDVSTVLVLDQEDWSVQWSWGPGTLQGPHMPTMLANGHLLIYDNGVRRKWTRVIEVEPESGAIVWEYKGSPPESFYSELRGSAQRLPNGNTLICESDRGHVIEVTPGGEIVWEFWNTDLSELGRQCIYRFLRHPAQVIEPLLRRGREASDK